MPTSEECKSTSDRLYASITEFVSEQPFFRNLVGGIKAGDVEISMFRKLVDKQIESEWVDAIEACLLPLDNVIRKPGRYIEELDEVKPIELSRNITSRSIQHLSQHTDYITEVKGDVITPSKILNVFHEETLLTYENKFVNTLIRQLYLFVSKRYKEMVKAGTENSTSFDISADFKDGTVKANVRFGLTVSESAEGQSKTDPLLARVMKLNSVVTMYYNSPFAKSMNGAYIRPPVMRTNALLKNRDLRQCLELWQFIESYEKVGYSISVEQTAEKPDRALIERMYADLALQYTVFRREIAKVADTIAEEPGVPFQPLFVQEIQPIEQEKFNLTDCVYRKITPVSYINPPRKLSKDELKIRAAVDEALALDAYLKKGDRIENAKRAAAELARKKAAEIKREAARLKREEEARAIAQYYSSLGYKVRIKPQDSSAESVVVEPQESAAATLSREVNAIDKSPLAEGNIGREKNGTEGKKPLGFGLENVGTAGNIETEKDEEMPSLEEIYGNLPLAKPFSSKKKDSSAEGISISTKKEKTGKGFVLVRMIPFGSESMEETERTVSQNKDISTEQPVLGQSPDSTEEKIPDVFGEQETKAPDLFEEESALEKVESAVETEESEMEEYEIGETEKAVVEEETAYAMENDRLETENGEEYRLPQSGKDISDGLAAGMSPKEREIFEKDTLGLTLEEKVAYRKMSRAKRRVFKKIAETRLRQAELRMKNERLAAAAMDKAEKLRNAAIDRLNYIKNKLDGKEKKESLDENKNAILGSENGLENGSENGSENGLEKDVDHRAEKALTPDRADSSQNDAQNKSVDSSSDLSLDDWNGERKQ